MLRTKISQSVCFSLFILLIGCSIVPDESVEDLPELKIKNITITRDDGKVLKGTVVYEGSVTNPTKIIVQWDGGFKLLQIPITDSVSVITKTIYHTQNKRIVKIVNVNNKDVEVRTEDFSYDAKGYLAKHTRQEAQGNTLHTYENLFYYESLDNQVKFDYITQSRCKPAGCVNVSFNGGYETIGYQSTSPSDSKTAGSFGFVKSPFSDDLDEGNNTINYRDPQTGITSSLEFEEFYERATNGLDRYDLKEFNFWGYKNFQEDFLSIDLNLKKAEFLLNLYYYVGNYILPQNERVYIEDVNGDGAPFGQDYNYNVSAFGKSSPGTPVFWILSRLSLPVDQYNFSKASSQEFETGRRSLIFKFDLEAVK